MEDTNEIVRALQAIGQDTRLKILKVLASGTLCVCELEEILGITQPAISHHLAILKDAKLVEDSREGQWVFYSANLARIAECCRALQVLFEVPLGRTSGMEGLAAKVKEIAASPRAPRRCRVSDRAPVDGDIETTRERSCDASTVILKGGGERHS